MIALAIVAECMLSLAGLGQAYDAILVTTNSQHLVIDRGWQVTNTSDTPLLPEHAYTWNAQKNHLYNPASLSAIDAWYNTSSLFTVGNVSVPVRDFHYTSAFYYNWSIIQNTSGFVYQLYANAVPRYIRFLYNNSQVLELHTEYTFGAFYFPDVSSNVVYSMPLPGQGGDPVNQAINPQPLVLITLELTLGNTYVITIQARNATTWQTQLSPYFYSTIPNIVQTGFLNTSFLTNAPNRVNLSLQITPGPHQINGPPPYIALPNDVVFAENSNWWLPDENSAFIAFPGLVNQQKTIEVLGFDATDIYSFIKCNWINYQKPLSWEARFSQNLTVSRYSNTKYFTEMPQIAYQTSFFPVLDTFDVFNVTSNYYVAAWGQLFNASKYNRTLFQIFSTDDEFLVSIAWETSGLLNFTVVLMGTQYPNTIPAYVCTTNDWIEAGLFIINNTYFGISVANNLVVWNLTYTTAVPRTLQVYGSLFRGSEVRDNINVTSLIAEICTDISAYVVEMPLFAQTFFLSRYRSVSQTLTYSFDIVSPSQDEARFRRNWTFSPSDIYFRDGSSRAQFSAQSSRTTLSILYLMQILRGETEYDRAEIYNRTNYHTTLAGKLASSSVRIALSFQYVMLTIDYIVPLVVQFDISLTYYLFATTKPPTILDQLLGAPMLALLTPLIVLIMFPVLFWEVSGKRRLFAGIGLLVGIVFNAAIGLIEPVLAILFGIIASVILFLLFKQRDTDTNTSGGETF